MSTKKKFPFLLASKSPARKQLLLQIGITPDLIWASNIDESPKKREIPHIYSKRIAIEKCTAALNNHENHVVLSADTTVACGRRIMQKACNEEEAYSFLEWLSGRQHRVYTTICLAVPLQEIRIKTSVTKVKFKRLGTEEIARYVESKEWQDKAGGYAIQGYAGAFVERINGSYSGIVGLPICETSKLLQSY